METQPEVGPSIHVQGIGQIGITVRDVAEAKNFYQNILGMKFLFDAGSMAFFQCGSIRLMVGLAEEPVSPQGTILYFRVAEIQPVFAQWKAQGVEVLVEPHLVAKMPDHDLWMAFLQDPSGNTLALMSEMQNSLSPSN
jgi:methylmalonyl-CoA/ethylmalonyl-CoA epimerase